MKKIANIALILCVLCLGYSCKNQKNYSEFTQSFIQMVENNPEMKTLLVESIDKCKALNPDKESNPVQSLEEYYDFVEWSTHCMPWNIAPQPEGRDLFNRIDQSLNYFYWLVDQPLDELQDSTYFRPTLQYHEPFRTWLIDYTKEWGKYLDTEDSWNQEYLDIVLQNEAFGVSKGWYEDASNWHSFNDFFSRRLVSPDARPIAGKDDESVVCSPADSEPQGMWEIDSTGCFVLEEGVVVKSRRFHSAQEILAQSAYRDSFCCGTMTHTFLNVHDYHRYHFPVSGKILEMFNVPGDDALGGEIVYDPETRTYIIECYQPTWQAIETRAVAIVQTKEYGLVAVLPIGMSQVCSCMWEENLAAGQEITKGDPMGYFLFGGSDYMLFFQKGVHVEYAPTVTPHQHILMGEDFCRLSKAE